MKNPNRRLIQNPVCGLLAAIAFSLLAVPYSFGADVLINHTFKGGDGTLNGVKVEGGTLQTGGLEWVSEPDTEITAGGAMTVTKPEQSAYIEIGSAISKGEKNDIYTLEIVVENQTVGNAIITGGFWELPASNKPPNVKASQDGNGGTAWWFWRGAGEFGGQTGPNFTKNNVAAIPAGQFYGTGSITTVLDFTGYDGSTNFGTVSMYNGSAAKGTLLGSAKFSGEESFEFVGFSTRFGTEDKPAMGTIKSLTLTKGR
jgi:hypothetical protein